MDVRIQNIHRGLVSQGYLGRKDTPALHQQQWLNILNVTMYEIKILVQTLALYNRKLKPN